MVEIKSTLDLVMEKTRHLRLSTEEKAEQHADPQWHTESERIREEFSRLLSQEKSALTASAH